LEKATSIRSLPVPMLTRVHKQRLLAYRRAKRRGRSSTRRANSISRCWTRRDCWRCLRGKRRRVSTISSQTRSQAWKSAGVDARTTAGLETGATFGRSRNDAVGLASAFDAQCAAGGRLGVRTGLVSSIGIKATKIKIRSNHIQFFSLLADLRAVASARVGFRVIFDGAEFAFALPLPGFGVPTARGIAQGIGG